MTYNVFSGTLSPAQCKVEMSIQATLHRQMVRCGTILNWCNVALY